MTSEPISYRQLFDAISTPAFVVSTEATIEHANRAAIVLVGSDLIGRSLLEFHRAEPARLRKFLRNASGSTGATMGRISLEVRGGQTRQMRCKGRLLRAATAKDPALLLLECIGGVEPFTALGEQVKQLNEEIRRRRHAQAVLEESVRQRDVLMRELHHRVRNNLQLVVGILTAAKSEAESTEARMALQEAEGRVAAIGAVQQTLFALEQSEFISGPYLIKELCSSLKAGVLWGSQVTYNLDPLSITSSIATPFALVLNELLTNAAKYGKNGSGEVQIEIDLKRAGDGFVLVVQDHGPGFQQTDTKLQASGLGLVRGLLRQVGGSFEVQNANGARCIVRIRQDAQREPVQ